MSDGDHALASLDSVPKADKFFRRLVDDAVSDHGLDASEATELYLVGLLTDHAHSPRVLEESDEPYAVRLAKALEAQGGERFARLRSLGDDVLFVSGFFSEHLETRGVPLNYVTSLGRVAYSGVASMMRRYQSGPAVFDELSAKFGAFVSLLRHISDSLFTTNQRGEAGVLELYERWQRTRSRVLAEALIGMGVVPSTGSNEQN